MKKVIIAEDEYILIKTFTRIIEKHGHKVLAATSTEEETILKCCQLKPDIVLLDISIEKKTSGIDICKQIKQCIPEVKVYFLTAYSEDVFEKELQNIEYDGYINKLDFREKVPEILNS